MVAPQFFEQVPPLRLHDGLAQLLGNSDDGIVEYHFADAARLAGHSCPTVAGAWLCARAALKHLYGEDMPERGGISVYLEDAEDDGVTGVIAQVLTLITGAAADNGFKGLGGRFARNHLLHFASGNADGIRFRREDTGQTVDVQLDTRCVPADPMQRQLAPLVVSGQADAAQQREFGRLWQARVRWMLLEHADDPALIQVKAGKEGHGKEGQVL